jgi:Tfp pilus assembly protein PilO
MNRADTTLAISVGVMIIIVVATFFVGIRPLLARYQSLRNEQTQNQKTLDALGQRVNALSILTRDRIRIEDLGQRAFTYLPTDVEAGPYLMDLAAMAGATQTSVSSATFQPSDPKKATASLTELPVSVTAGGTFPALIDLLRALEENLRFINISALNFSLQQEIGISLQITGAIYSKPEDKTPKDQSLTIDENMEALLTGRRKFGEPITTGGPNKPNPFEEL